MTADRPPTDRPDPPGTAAPAGDGPAAAGGPPVEATPPALAARDIVKRFDGVTALDGVTLEVRAGAVTCLLGDNGAGKSTLIKVISGVHAPTGGRVELDGRPITLASPRDARRRGIATVHQDPALVPLMSVWRNFFLGREPIRGRGPARRLDVAAARTGTRRGLEAFGIHIDDVDRPLATLSGGERQSVAIARAVDTGARVLILDEPTAALGVRPAGKVLDRIARARDTGVGVVLVSHNPVHAAEVGDTFVVLRNGRVAARPTGAATAARLAALMAGTADGGDRSGS